MYLLCKRVCKKNLEDYLQFIKVHDMSSGLSDAVLLPCLVWDYTCNIQLAIGQEYDSAAAMSRKYYGVHKFNLDKYPGALYLYCSAHCLNLVYINYYLFLLFIYSSIIKKKSLYSFFSFKYTNFIIYVCYFELFLFCIVHIYVITRLH